VLRFPIRACNASMRNPPDEIVDDMAVAMTSTQTDDRLVFGPGDRKRLFHASWGTTTSALLHCVEVSEKAYSVMED
jgi:hypothetical protein